MCDRTNAEEIVGEMLEYLETADYSIREEMVCLIYCKTGKICSVRFSYKLLDWQDLMIKI